MLKETQLENGFNGWNGFKRILAFAFGNAFFCQNHTAAGGIIRLNPFNPFHPFSHHAALSRRR